MRLVPWATVDYALRSHSPRILYALPIQPSGRPLTPYDRDRVDFFTVRETPGARYRWQQERWALTSVTGYSRVASVHPFRLGMAASAHTTGASRVKSAEGGRLLLQVLNEMEENPPRQSER